RWYPARMTSPVAPVRNRHATESIGIAALVPSPIPVDAGGGNAWTDTLQAAALVVGLLFIVLAVYNWLAFPPGVRGPVCLHDLGLIALGFGIYATCRKRRALSLSAVHWCAAILSFGVLSNILLAAALGSSPLFSHYVSVLIIASAGSVMFASWAIGIA